MSDIWVPEWEHKPLGRSGGAYDPGRRMKLAWHTWEGTSWEVAEDTFHRYPPTVGVKIGEQPRQYVPLNLHSFAFKGSESDDEPVIQVELAGFARDMRHLSDDDLRWLATNVVDPMNRALHRAGWPTVPPVVPADGFRDEQDRGWLPLATSTSRLRMTNREFEAYSGHLGHQHAPAPDSHWDPGALNVARMLTFCRFGSSPSEEDDMTPDQAEALDAARADARAAKVLAQRAVEILEGKRVGDEPTGKAKGTLLARIRDDAATQTGLLQRIADKLGVKV